MIVANTDSEDSSQKKKVAWRRGAWRRMVETEQVWEFSLKLDIKYRGRHTPSQPFSVLELFILLFKENPQCIAADHPWLDWHFKSWARQPQSSWSAMIKNILLLSEQICYEQKKQMNGTEWCLGFSSSP